MSEQLRRADTTIYESNINNKIISCNVYSLPGCHSVTANSAGCRWREKLSLSGVNCGHGCCNKRVFL